MIVISLLVLLLLELLSLHLPLSSLWSVLVSLVIVSLIIISVVIIISSNIIHFTICLLSFSSKLMHHLLHHWILLSHHLHKSLYGVVHEHLELWHVSTSSAKYSTLLSLHIVSLLHSDIFLSEKFGLS